MLVDEVKIRIKGGDGGSGLVHFYHDRHRPKGGPDGGDGGRGGDIYALVVSDIMALKNYRHEIEYGAENGDNGGINKRTGKNGQDLILKIPVGSTIYYDNGSQIELSNVDQKVLLARGGNGGRGNYFFRSSVNRQPKEFEIGQKCEWKKLRVELKLIADIGLIGLPNAGKTSLLNELTNARAKVANYPFTTLEPNLGVSMGGKIIADIPGLIEGASMGKGLGIKFLKHVEKTKILLHCLACDSSDIKRDYQIIRQEISQYSQKLAKLKEYIILTKSDLIDDSKTINRLIKVTKAKMAVSIADEDSLKKLSDFLHNKLD